MRVLLWMIAGGDRIAGGHRVQLEMTARHLRALDVVVDTSLEEYPNLAGYDLVHGFGLGPEEIRYCHQRRVPVALSTIYCNRDYLLGQHILRGRWETWKRRARWGTTLLWSALQGRYIEKCVVLVERLTCQRIAFEMADILLPNSEMEATTIRAELNTRTPYRVVPNAVDPTLFRTSEEAQATARNHALYVGRIEPHKNQLGLIEALRGSDIPLVIVGPVHPDHAAYYEQCRRRATGNIALRPGVSHEELVPLYTAARVHLLPSWFETTGLVSLEAALCGCNIVTTERGYAREYFEDLAWYCDPADPRAIRKAVEMAFHAPYRFELRERILSRFTWQHTACATLVAYNQVVTTKPGR